jgi:hypothetical protein
MRRPSILDVLRAVRDVGPAHPEVRAWWYAPGRKPRLAGGLPGDENGGTLEIVVETADDGADLARIGGDLADRLRRGPVSVRPHRGNGEERQLYRLLSNGKAASVPESAPGGAGAPGGG